jgi:hypothetical protein
MDSARHAWQLPGGADPLAAGSARFGGIHDATPGRGDTAKRMYHSI